MAISSLVIRRFLFQSSPLSAYKKKSKGTKGKNPQNEKAELAAKKSWQEKEFEPWIKELTKRFSPGWMLPRGRKREGLLNPFSFPFFLSLSPRFSY
jgi:hypothetical protein